MRRTASFLRRATRSASASWTYVRPVHHVLPDEPEHQLALPDHVRCSAGCRGGTPQAAAWNSNDSHSMAMRSSRSATSACPTCRPTPAADVEARHVLEDRAHDRLERVGGQWRSPASTTRKARLRPVRGPGWASEQQVATRTVLDERRVHDRECLVERQGAGTVQGGATPARCGRPRQLAGRELSESHVDGRRRALGAGCGRTVTVGRRREPPSPSSPTRVPR